MNRITVFFILVFVVASAAGLVIWMSAQSEHEDLLDRSRSDSVGSDSLIQASEDDRADTEHVTTNSEQATMGTKNVTLTTSKGDISMELYGDDFPNTVGNFVKLANEEFYDGIIFHRVIEGFMIQGGDPTGTGTGGPGYAFEDELKPESEAAQRGYARGTVAMANSGPDTNGSQFFIVHQDAPLPYQYTIFGRVTSGMDVVDAIATSETDGGDKPLEDIVIEKAVVEE
ncbi:MAG: peptidylprolyl isomerase [Candidatus Paceibacterota bacterium]